MLDLSCSSVTTTSQVREFVMLLLIVGIKEVRGLGWPPVA
jgi:hypothetical protein